MNALRFLLFLLLTHQVFSQSLSQQFYEDGTLKAEGIEGELGKEGSWKFYYPDGSTNSIEEYRHDMLHGKVEYYDFGGALIGEENWQQNLLQDSAYYYYSNGSLEKRGIYQDGLYEGKWQFFYEDGQI